MKLLKRIMVIVLAFVVAIMSIPDSPAYADVQTPTRTIMLYFDGSDLESYYSGATGNIIQMTESEYNENINIIIMTGCTRGDWNTPSEYLNGADSINEKYNQIWKLEGKKDGEEHGFITLIEETGISSIQNTKLGDPETLTTFVDYCYKNYPADLYDIILWDHGEGPVYGFSSSMLGGNELYLYETIQALSESDFYNDGNKFEIINYDACVMGNVEMIVALSSFTDYYIGAAEEEPVYGQYYTEWLNVIKDNPSMNGYEIGKKLLMIIVIMPRKMVNGSGRFRL